MHTCFPLSFFLPLRSRFVLSLALLMIDWMPVIEMGGDEGEKNRVPEADESAGVGSTNPLRSSEPPTSHPMKSLSLSYSSSSICWLVF